jgi:phosphatidylserine/phosphatidylglycerophosphate/cardiolipin synthase-like enzyme
MVKILQTGRNFWREERVTRAGILIDADDYYRAVYEAGQRATSYLLLAGWQFDTDACLLRGEDAEQAALPVTLLAYLNALCERRPALRIFVLAWDFHAVFGLEREWMQDVRFKWLTSERLQFLFDAHHAEGGSHHQKFVVVDGQLSFLGGLDLCDHRWDDRRHRVPNPLRVSRGAPHRPFHDVQAYLVGTEVGTSLVDLFGARWVAAGGEALLLSAPSGSFDDYLPAGATPLETERVALSRVDPFGQPEAGHDCREVEQLSLDAIAAAERLIYVETQYFSSKRLGEALARRLRTTFESPLDVVLVLNEHAETMKEQVAVGLTQAKVIKELREAARDTPHRLGIYYTVPEMAAGAKETHATYIHSKLFIVDDRFMTVGSANWTNRSGCLDTELNMAVEADDAQSALGRSIVRARESLLAEHLGVEGLSEPRELVTELDARARSQECRLRLHPSPTEAELAILSVIDPQQLPFDPAAPEADAQDRHLFVGGLGVLWQRLFPERS